MEHEELIPAHDFCVHHNIEYSFISSLQDSGLLQITSALSTTFIQADDLHKLEKFVRLYYDLDINIEGIETINYLLEKIEHLQRELKNLKNKLEA
jgi:chaperone modulatory protein CbpM